MCHEASCSLPANWLSEAVGYTMEVPRAHLGVRWAMPVAGFLRGMEDVVRWYPEPFHFDFAAFMVLGV